VRNATSQTCYSSFAEPFLSFFFRCSHGIIERVPGSKLADPG
jgi:hypothetical protein